MKNLKDFYNNTIKKGYNDVLTVLSDAGVPNWATHMLEGAVILLILQWCL